jgi:hypothetical protein
VALAPPWARCRPCRFRATRPDFPASPSVSPGAQSSRPSSRRGVILRTVASRPRAFRPKVSLLVLCNPHGCACARAARKPAHAVAFCLHGPSLAMAGSTENSGSTSSERSGPPAIVLERLTAAFASVGQDIAECRLLLPTRHRRHLVPPFLSRPVLTAVPYSTVVELTAPHLVVQVKPAGLGGHHGSSRAA